MGLSTSNNLSTLIGITLPEIKWLVAFVVTPRRTNDEGHRYECAKKVGRQKITLDSENPWL